jgi:hypothetical protein
VAFNYFAPVPHPAVTLNHPFSKLVHGVYLPQQQHLFRCSISQPLPLGYSRSSYIPHSEYRARKERENTSHDERGAALFEEQVSNKSDLQPQSQQSNIYSASHLVLVRILSLDPSALMSPTARRLISDAQRPALATPCLSHPLNNPAPHFILFISSRRTALVRSLISLLGRSEAHKTSRYHPEIHPTCFYCSHGLTTHASGFPFIGLYTQGDNESEKKACNI